MGKTINSPDKELIKNLMSTPQFWEISIFNVNYGLAIILNN